MVEVKVLFIHASEAFGGAAKSLLSTWSVLPPYHKGHVLVPKGRTAKAFMDAGLEVHTCFRVFQFDNTRYGYYRGWRWCIVLREIMFMPFAIFALFRLRGQSFDIIHANEITVLPVALLAKFLFKSKLVVHVRSVQAKDATPCRTYILNSLLLKFVDKLIAIDETVARSLSQSLSINIIRNGLRVRPYVRSCKSRSVLTIGMIGVLSHHKGLVELIEAISILKSRGLLIKCLIGGENIRTQGGLLGWFMQAFGVSVDTRLELCQRMIERGVCSQITMLGFVDDVVSFYEEIDVICFPAHLNAAGRPVFEAALLGRPSIVAVEDPPKDSLIHGETGFAVPSPDPVAIADAIEAYARDPEMTRRMGENARAWAREYFSIEKSGRELAALYASLVETEKTR